MLRSFATRLRSTVDQLFKNSDVPPIGWTPALLGINNTPVQSTSYGVADILNDMRILLGVPKYRTSKPKKITRKFSFTRLLTPVENLVSCQACGSKHQAETICGNCYSKVKELTNEIKRKMMQYNPYKGDKNDKELLVKFSDDKFEDGVVNGKRVVELEKERPSWFKKLM